MKITCQTKLLKEAIFITERNIGKNQTLPILQAILFSAEKGSVLIRATNLETAVEVSIPCKVEEGGSLVVSAKIISSFLSQIIDESVSIQSKSDNIFIKTLSTETTIRGYATDDFPLFPIVDHKYELSLVVSDIKESLQAVAISMSSSDMKPELASVYMKIFKNTITFAATDSFRLSEKKLTLKNVNFKDEVFVLIPYSSVLELLRILDISQQSESLLGGFDEGVDFYFNKHQLVMKSKYIRFISRLIEGNFPDYEQIIPKQVKTEVVVKKQDILRSLKLASILSGRLHEVIMSFSSKKKAILKTSSQETGEHVSEIEATVNGEDITVKFNWKYLIDGISQVRSEYATFAFNGDQAPITIKSKGDTSYIYIAMPMRNM
jgi:DNA polymerase-3 subunit beta